MPPGPDTEGVRSDWRDEELQGRMTDPRLTTNVRYFTRDMGYLRAVQEPPRRDTRRGRAAIQFRQGHAAEQ